MSLAERYLALAFRVGKHEPDLVENYYGPPEAVAAEEPRDPGRLVEEAEVLLADLGRDDLEPHRSAWIAEQTRSLLTTARRLAGERFSYADEVESTFGIRPRWYVRGDPARFKRLLVEQLLPSDLS
jgi:hypothetical protein